MGVEVVLFYTTSGRDIKRGCGCVSGCGVGNG